MRFHHGESEVETRGNYVLQGTGSKGNRTADAREQRDRARESRCIVPLHPRQEDIAVEFGTRVRRTIVPLVFIITVEPGFNQLGELPYSS